MIKSRRNMKKNQKKNGKTIRSLTGVSVCLWKTYACLWNLWKTQYEKKQKKNGKTM